MSGEASAACPTSPRRIAACSTRSSPRSPPSSPTAARSSARSGSSTTLEVRGQARIEPDDDGAFAHKLHGKYGADVSAYDKPGDSRVIVTLEPTRVRPVDMSG